MRPRVASTYCVKLGCVRVVVGTGQHAGLAGVVILDAMAGGVAVVGVFEAAVRCWDIWLMIAILIVLVECGRIVVRHGVVLCILRWLIC